VSFYQCFKTLDRTVYCSSTEFKNHTEGAAWVGRCMEQFDIQASQMHGKPYESDSQPRGAVIWPDD
jgi:hypothetical protein